jgi:hypothetical protein
MSAHGFRVYFTPLAGVLFTVPSRYYTLSVGPGTSPWGGGPPSFRRNFTCSGVLEMGSCGGRAVDYGALTLYGAVFQTASSSHARSHCADTPARDRLATPKPQRVYA